MKRSFGPLLSLVAIALVALVASPTVLRAQGLILGGSSANFGVFDVRGGFLPDPMTWSVVSGGSLSASSASSSCRGYVTAQPDVIVRYSGAASWVRFFVRASGDTTLVVNDARGRWWCSDDEGGYPNPMIDIASPPSGQYDIWVGSYRAGEGIPSTLHMTELAGVRP